jgi:hypothetical protein
MIRLEVDLKVFEELKKQVPKTNKAQERLDVYVANLEREVNHRLSQPRNVMMKKDEYFVSLTTIQQKGGKIESLQQIRTHKWLSDNGLALIEVTNKGQANNLTGEISKIKFTDLVKVKDDDDLDILHKMNDADKLNHLQVVPSSDVATYQSIIDEFRKLSKQAQDDNYDLLKVNVSSVIDYIIKTLRNRLTNKSRSECCKALRILRIAQLNNCIYPQKRKSSIFGRTYYEGVSIQSVKKDLRQAILKDCYEYDAKSSVVAWKYSFAELQMASEGKIGSVEDEFVAIYYYLTYKPEYFDDLRKFIFNAQSDWNVKEQNDAIKSAITALNFGAKLADITWRNEYGKEEHSSLVDIFEDHIDERKRFMKAKEVRQFKELQSRLDKFIVNKFWTQYSWLDGLTELKTDKGKRSNAKILAWLYQHAETKMMNLVREELDKMGVIVKANIHDAIVVDRKLSKYEREHIERVIRTITGVDFFALGEKQY